MRYSFHIRLLITFLLILILLGFALFGKLSDELIVSLSSLLTSREGIITILFSSVFLFSNLLLSSWRFHDVSAKFGIDLPFWENHKINIYSLLYSMFLIPSLAQIAGRVNHGRNKTDKGHLYVSITIFEKIISSVILLGLVIITNLGRQGSLSFDNNQFIYLAVFGVSLLVIVTLLFKYFVSDDERAKMIEAVQVIRQIGFLSTSLVTIIIHLSSLIGFLILGVYFFPDVPLFVLASSLVLVILATTIPISFSGLGIRELSAVAVFSQLGLSLSTALVLSGVLSVLLFLVLFLHFGLVFFLMPKKTEGQPDDKELIVSKRSVPVFNQAALLTFGVFLLSALLPFQLRLPTSVNEVTVNMADPIAFLIGFTFFVFWILDKHRTALWAERGFGLALLLAVAMLIYGWLVGFINFGSSQWAGVNRMTGVIILFGYVMSGAAVGRLLGDKGVWYSITLLASALMLTVFAQLLMAYFIDYDVRHILQWWYDISGFMVNRNAFALMAMLLLCFLLARQKQAKNSFERQNLLLAGLIMACVLTQSRVVLILLPLLLIWYYVMGYITIGKLLLSVMVMGAVMILWGLLMPALMKIITGVQGFPIIAYRFGAYAPDRGDTYASEIIGNNESDVLRGENWTNAWELFISSPIFGSGLGGFLHHYQEKVIHNVPLWIATEMGIIGLLLILTLPMILLYYIFKQGVRLSEQKFILLNCLLVWGTFSMVQDMSFQRIIWYILGLMLAVRIISHSQNITKDKENDA